MGELPNPHTCLLQVWDKKRKQFVLIPWDPYEVLEVLGK